MMRHESRSVGESGGRLLIAEGASGDASAVVDIAAALAPFPPARGNAYPGLRRMIGNADHAAAGYSRDLLRRLVPLINATFDLAGFDLLTASFSMVTAPPDRLAVPQRMPHFDSLDPNYLAILHYLGGTDGSGTAFYRQRATGIDRVTDANRAAFIAAAEREAAGWSGYIGGSTPSFERIDMVAAVPDRVIVYQGSLLHSGTIPPGMSFSDDPRTGRLTANFFVRGRPRAPRS
jgi:hypothetical protein